MYIYVYSRKTGEKYCVTHRMVGELKGKTQGLSIWLGEGCEQMLELWCFMMIRNWTRNRRCSEHSRDEGTYTVGLGNHTQKPRWSQVGRGRRGARGLSGSGTCSKAGETFGRGRRSAETSTLVVGFVKITAGSSQTWVKLTVTRQLKVGGGVNYAWKRSRTYNWATSGWSLLIHFPQKSLKAKTVISKIDMVGKRINHTFLKNVKYVIPVKISQ